MKKKSPLKKTISPLRKAKLAIKDSPAVLFLGPMLKASFRGKIDLPRGIPCLLIDGGKDFVRKKNSSTISIGDSDSSSGPLDITLSPQKDYSDFAFALKILPRTAKILFLRGFLGGRRDHELFNMGEIFHFLRGKKGVMAFFDKEIIAIGPGKYELELEGTFSLACFEKTKIDLHGDCLYPVKNRFFAPVSSLGLSNEAHGRIHIQVNRPIFILIEGQQ